MADSVSDLVPVLYELEINGFASVAVAAFSFYDYVITFEREVEAVWQREFSTASVLIIAVRWVIVLQAIASQIPPSEKSCYAIIILVQAFELLGYLLTALVSALRASAIWNHNHVIFFTIFALGAVPVGTNILALTHSTIGYVGPPITTCGQAINLSDGLILTIVLVTRIPVITADALVLLLTWLKTFRQIREARRLRMRVSIAECLLRDGTLYFAVLLVINVAQILTESFVTAPVTPFTVTMPLILINRFMLNLRLFDRRDEGSTDVPVSASVLFQAGSSFAADLAMPGALTSGGFSSDATESHTETFEMGVSS